MKKGNTIILIIVIFIISCQNNIERSYYPSGKLKESYKLSNGIYNGKHIKYYENGNKWFESTYLKGWINGVRTEYYSNGKIKEQGLYSFSSREGWFTKFDSIYSKKISEKYYSKGKLYTQVDYNTNGHCTYYYIQPEIFTKSNKDTLYLKRTDSLEIVFHQRDTLLKIKSYSQSTRAVFSYSSNPALNQQEILCVAKVYPKKNKNFVEFNHEDSYFIFGRDTGRLFHECYNVSEVLDEDFADSLDIHSTNSFIYYYRLK